MEGDFVIAESLVLKVSFRLCGKLGKEVVDFLKIQLRYQGEF